MTTYEQPVTETDRSVQPVTGTDRSVVNMSLYEAQLYSAGDTTKAPLHAGQDIVQPKTNICLVTKGREVTDRQLRSVRRILGLGDNGDSKDYYLDFTTPEPEDLEYIAGWVDQIRGQSS